MKELTIKKSNPIIDKAAELREQGRAELMNLESFTSALNRKPAVVKVNKFAKNSEYVPIGHIQTLLDTLFFGLWQTKNFKKDVIANELVGSIELWVFHPVTKDWIVRTGVAATQIRQEKNAKLTDIDKKIKNALEQDAPHLYADCVKSAAKTLGPAFGRDLNRDYVDNYKTIVSNHVQANKYNIEEVGKEVKKYTNAFELLEYYESNSIWKQDTKIKNLFEERKQEILRGDFS